MTPTDPYTPPEPGAEPPADEGAGFDVDFEGRILLGRFRVGRRIGQGGMAFVYEATDAHDDDAKVVVKVPKAKEVAQPGFRAEFQREVDGLRHLKRGVHVVKILARGEADGFPFLVLEHLGGGTLQTRLQAAGDQWVSLRSIESWLRPMARALDSVHAEGWIHRDVKPANILFDDRGAAYLSDFGVAKNTRAKGHATSKGVVSGSFAYMAPEQAAGGMVTSASDQFALAATVYRALSGRCIYEPGPDTTDVRQLLARVEMKSPRPLRELAPQISEHASAVVMDAMSYDPADRFPSCVAFVDTLYTEASPTRAATPAIPAADRSVAPAAREEPSAASVPAAPAPGAALAGVGAGRPLPDGAPVQPRASQVVVSAPPLSSAPRAAEGRSAVPVRIGPSRGWALGGLGVVALAVGSFLMLRGGPSEPADPREPLARPDADAFPEESSTPVPDDRPIDAKPAGPSAPTLAEAEGGAGDLREDGARLRREAEDALYRVPPWARVTPSQVAEAHRLGVPVAFENSLGMRFVLIPAGSFKAGVSDPKNRAPFVWSEGMNREAKNELQDRWRVPPPYAAEVTHSFYLQATEVTNRQLRAWSPDHVSIDGNVIPPAREILPALEEPHRSAEAARIAEANRIAAAIDADDHPATAVSYREAVRFVAWLSGREGRSYRLPTEVEWEHAARAGGAEDFFWGQDPGQGTSFAVLDAARSSSPVAALRPNPWGLWDVVGNASEFCEMSEEVARAYVTAFGPEEGRGRRTWTLKGGDFDGERGRTVPLGYREENLLDAEDSGYTGVGLRVAVDIPQR